MRLLTGEMGMVATDWGVVTTPYPGCFWSPYASNPVVSGSGGGKRMFAGVMDTEEPRLNKRPRGWLAAGGRGGGRRRRGGQRVGGARGSSGRRLKKEAGGPGPRPLPGSESPRLQADGWGFFRRWRQH